MRGYFPSPTKVHFIRELFSPTQCWHNYCVGTTPLCVVSGRKNKFLISPAIRPNATMNIQIKENKKGYEFAIIPEPGQDFMTTVKGEHKRFTVEMFDSEIINVDNFKIWVEDGRCVAAGIKYDQTEKILVNRRVKQYTMENPISREALLKFGGNVLGGLGGGAIGLLA